MTLGRSAPAGPSIGRRLRYRTAALVPQVAPALLVMILVEVGLHVTTLPRLASLLGIAIAEDAGTVPPHRPVTLPRWSRRRVLAARRVLGVWPFGDTCLRQCLVIGQRLRRLEPVLRIGVRPEPDGSLLAHSWLEIEGASIDPTSSTFLTFGGR